MRILWSRVAGDRRRDGLDHRDPESPWSAWSIEERRDFQSLFLHKVTVTKAQGHNGGDRVAWRGHERLRFVWVDEVVPF